MLPLSAITIGSQALPDTNAPSLPTGTFEGRVIQNAAGLAVRIGGIQIPLPENAPFLPGQNVTVTRSAPQAPLQVSHAPLDQNPRPQIADALTKVLAQLSVTFQRAPETLSPLIPRSAPLTHSQIHQILSLFSIRGTLGADLASIATQLQTAIASGWNPPPWLESFLRLALAKPGAEPQAIAEWLRNAQKTAAQIPESALLAENPNPQESLLTQIRLLRADKDLRALLEASGKWSAFTAQADAAIERLEARSLHQLHALDANYVFLELPSPLPNDSSDIHIHWFGRNTADGAGFDEVVLDLNLSQLGEIWATIQSDGRACRCTLRLRQTDAVDALRNQTQTLEQSLLYAGYHTASVLVQQWDGDRLAATAHLMQRGNGLNTSA